MKERLKCPKEIIERLICEYSPSMLRVCRCYLKEESAAEDAVQDVFLKICRTWPGFDNRNSERAWIRQVTVNRCRDILRSGWLRKVTLVDSYPEYSAAGEEKEEGALVQQIEGLKPAYRQTVILYYYQDLSIHEIAQIQHTADSTVYTRLYRARQTLQAALKTVSCEEW